ncbi:MAG: ATP-binding cassette domain-containing protein [Desulfovibrionaceae bacterium]
MARTDVLDRTGTEPVVETRGLGKRYGSVRALQDASLRVAPGEWFGVIGPDGSGKSSLLSILAGVLRFEEGECRVLGADLSGRRAAEGIKDDVGFLPQGLGEHLAPDLSVRESLSFFGRLHGMDEERLEERSARLLEATRLGGAESRRPGLHPAARTLPAAFGRAGHGPGPRVPAGTVGNPGLGHAREGGHDHRLHGVHGRGQALRPAGDAAPGPDHGRRPAGGDSGQGPGQGGRGPH